MTREEHLDTCRACRASVSCIEWYRNGFAGCWCNDCGKDHFVTWVGPLLPDDIVTITWVSGWMLVNGTMNPGPRIEHGYVNSVWLRVEEEGATWIRGVPPRGVELDALLAASALVKAPRP